MATPLMNLTLPTVSSTAGPTYAVNINAALTTIDSHNHTSGRGALIPTAALSINADVPFNNYAVSGAYSVRLTNQSAALPGGLDVNSLYAANGNLYFNNSSGTSVQLTSGSAINAGGFGAWTGDYVAAGAQGKYTQATTSFSLLNGDTSLSSLYTAKLSAGQAAGTSLGTSVLVANGPAQMLSTLSVTGALSGAAAAFTGNTTVGGTLGVTGAASTGALTATGALTGTSASFSGTAGANALTVTTSVSAATLGLSGNATVGGALTTTGAASSASLSVTGAPQITGASTSLTVPVNKYAFTGQNANFYYAGPVLNASSGGNSVIMPVHLPFACTITGMTAVVVSSNTPTGAFTVNCSLVAYPSSPAQIVMGTPSNVSGSLPISFLLSMTTAGTQVSGSATGGTYAIGSGSDAIIIAQIILNTSGSTSNSCYIAGVTVQVTTSALSPGVR